MNGARRPRDEQVPKRPAKLCRNRHGSTGFGFGMPAASAPEVAVLSSSCSGVTRRMAPRIWTGIAAPVAVVSGLLLVIAVGSAWYIRNMQESVATMLEENVTSMRAAQEL